MTTAAALCASALTTIPSTNAFAPQPSVMGVPSSSTRLAARNGMPIHEDSAENSRRDVLKSSLGALFAGLTLATNVSVEPASASYSAYSNREKDWDERKKSGGMSSSDDHDDPFTLALFWIDPKDQGRSIVYPCLELDLTTSPLFRFIPIMSHCI